MPATTIHRSQRRATQASAALLVAAATALAASHAPAAEPPGAQQRLVPLPNPTLDRSGRAQIGKGSFYADFFAGRTMANGEPFRLDTNNAASRTLPFGTTARVTNLENGRSAVVVIKDRGPYVEGRIVDVSPSTARQLDMLDDGVVAVEVVPIALPPGGGAAKRDVAVGDAARSTADR